jgi:hypothetical protein
MSERPWYHLHLVTCLVLVFMCMLWPVNPHAVHFFWPLDIEGYWRLDQFYGPYFPVLAIDLLVFLAGTLSTAATLERWLRSSQKWRLRLSTALVLTAIAVILLIFAMWDAVLANDFQVLFSTEGNEWVGYRPLVEEGEGAWEILVEATPVYVALGCTIYMAGHGVAWILRRLQ